MSWKRINEIDQEIGIHLSKINLHENAIRKLEDEKALVMAETIKRENKEREEKRKSN